MHKLLSFLDDRFALFMYLVETLVKERNEVFLLIVVRMRATKMTRADDKEGGLSNLFAYFVQTTIFSNFPFYFFVKEKAHTCLFDMKVQ